MLNLQHFTIDRFQRRGQAAELGQTFGQHYLLRVFVPTVRFMVSRFIRSQFRILSRESAPPSVKVSFLSLI